ncbi:hypothetical protein M878_28950 [Streptomyces roseochromogenus subsp. oscitans DS 12.976]|uniref:Uncharacterized protein n=1 Tax=Streptomyces roseochromogenus subsp. oscitans DS 12.976 TaxID=1352936 RepID=V6JZS7_STRRC|nr:hypothetical protein M878_28950 [Streptomyces roseochromogenus subsp. oscitans DS 12.976]
MQHQRRLTDSRSAGYQQHLRMGETVIEETVERLTFSASVDEALSCKGELVRNRRPHAIGRRSVEMYPALYVAGLHDVTGGAGE